MAVAQQPMPGVGPGGGNPLLVGTVGGHREWDTGILSCFTDCKSLIMTWFCLPCALCNISSRQGDFPCMPWFVPGSLIAMRARIRTLGGIHGSICGDCLATSFCGLCVVCQMERELTAMRL